MTSVTDSGLTIQHHPLAVSLGEIVQQDDGIFCDQWRGTAPSPVR